MNDPETPTEEADTSAEEVGTSAEEADEKSLSFLLLIMIFLGL